jgi:hypothetical protein
MSKALIEELTEFFKVLKQSITFISYKLDKFNILIVLSPDPVRRTFYPIQIA